MEQRTDDKQKTNSKMLDLHQTISILILAMNHLNNPVKRQSLLDLVKKQDLTACCLQETSDTQ